MNAFAYIFTAWVPIFTFPTSKQPYIVVGNYVNAGFGACALLLALAIGYLHNRDIKRAQTLEATSDSDLGSADIP
jgi:ACS family pantothenate transporter-like MFS transporter